MNVATSSWMPASRQDALEVLPGAADDAQRIADLVRDAGGHAAHGGQVLLPAGGLARAPERRDDPLQDHAEHRQDGQDDAPRVNPAARRRRSRAAKKSGLPLTVSTPTW